MMLTGRSRLPAGPLLAALLVLAFLLLFLIVPVGTVFHTAFVNADGSFTLGHFGAFFGQPLMKEAFFNSLYVAGWSALLASLIAVPLAYFTVRFDFRGALIIQTLGGAAPHHAALRRRGGDAIAVRPFGVGQPAAR